MLKKMEYETTGAKDEAPRLGDCLRAMIPVDESGVSMKMRNSTGYGDGSFVSRTETRRITRRFPMIMLAAVMMVLAVLSPAMAQTIGAPKLGTGDIEPPVDNPWGDVDPWKGDYVYYGTYDGKPLKYRVLSPSEDGFSEGEGVYHTLLLDCDSIVKTDWFGRNTDAHWAGDQDDPTDSHARDWLNGTFFKSLTTGEQKAIALSKKDGPVSYYDGEGYDKLDWTPLDGDRIFLLDAMEATNHHYGYRSDYKPNPARTKKTSSGIPSPWWLRSIGKEDDRYAGYVTYVPQLSVGAISIDQGAGMGEGLSSDPPEKGLSPAFNVKLSSIIFSSEIEPEDGAGNDQNDVKTYKLTLLDDEIKVSASKITIEDDTKVRITYNISGINRDNVDRVFAMAVSREFSNINGWKDNNGINNAYILAQAESKPSEGEVELTLNSGLWSWDEGIYIYIIAEDQNEVLKTNYAGAPVRIERPKHVHNWVYTADGNKITAHCNIALHTGGSDELIIKHPDYINPGDLVYDGTPQEAYLTATGNNGMFDPEEYGIEYYQCTATDEDEAENEQCEELLSPPVNAGKYIAAVTVNNITAKVTYTIYPKIANVKVKDQTIPEGGSISSGLDMAELSDVVEGHRLSAINLYVDGELVDGAEIKANIYDTKIADEDGKDVTANYVIRHNPKWGRLTVKPAVEYQVTFKVVNGRWNDKTSDVKTFTLKGFEDEILRLSAEQIPAAGSEPNTGCKAGSWNITPDTETAVTKDTTFIYTYAKKSGPKDPPVWPICINCSLPETGFSSSHQIVLPEKPADLNYKPLGMRLMIPSLNVDSDLVTVPLDGDQWAVEWLGDQSGILAGSALPGRGYSVAAAHNTLNDTEIGPFALLNTMKVNDVIAVADKRGGLRSFRVFANELLEPDDMKTVAAIASREENTLVLITCENESTEGGYRNRRVIFARPDL